MKRIHPESRSDSKLYKGVRIQYVENSAVRSERIHARHGNTITVINAVGRKKRIKLQQVKGYWKGKVKATLNNLEEI